MDINSQLQEKVYKLFEEGKITRFIGYEKGSFPYKTRPCIITKKEDAKRLIFNQFCVNNLSIYLRGDFEKTGILANFCTLKSIVALRQGNQIKLESIYPHTKLTNSNGLSNNIISKDLQQSNTSDNSGFGMGVYILAVNCPGMVDSAKNLYDKCKTCHHDLPKIYPHTKSTDSANLSDSGNFGNSPQNDSFSNNGFGVGVYHDLIGEEISVSCEPIDEYGFIKEFEKLSQGERWKFWEKEFSKCIRCYACRNVCPICYCRECVVDKTNPQWVSKLNQSSTNEYYNLMRVIHVIGRCIDCGECERVCPVKIPYRKLIKKMEKEIKELYGYVPGMDPNDLPPLAVFKEGDSEEGIK